MQEKFAVKIGKLLSVRPKTKAGFSTAYVYEPHDLEEKEYGSLYFVAEIASPSPNAHEIGKTIIEIVKDEFYKDLGREAPLSFEAALKKANKFLADLAEEGEIFWLGKINAVIACLEKNNLHLSSVGGASVHLLREGGLTEISKDLNPEGKPDPMKTFANILSGELQVNDKVIFSTPGLFYKISKDKLKKIASEFSPPAAVGELVSKLQQEEDALGISLIIIEFQTQEAISEEPLAEVPSEVWLKKPETKLETLKKNLDPVWEKVKVALSSGFEKAKGLTQEKIIPSLKKIGQKKSAPTLKPAEIQKIAQEGTAEKREPVQKPATPKTVSFFDSFKEGFSVIFSFFKKYFRIITSDIKRLKLTDFKTKTSQRYLIIFLACLLLLTSSIVFMNFRRNQAKLASQYEETLQNAKTKEGAALQSLIYNERTKARKLLTEAKKLLEDLAKVGYKQNEVFALLSKIEEDFNKVNGVVKISLKEKANFSNFESDAQTSNLTYLANKFYSINTKNNKIFYFDTKTSKTESISTGANLKFLINLGDKILVYSDTPQIWQVNLEEGNLTKVSLPIDTNWQKAADASHYQGNLYLLCPEENQLSKYWKTYSGYSKPFAYYRNTDLKNSKAIAISTFVYVLKDDGKIIKLAQGKVVSDFKVKGLPNALKNPTDIYTREGFSNLYVADPANKRIVVLDENGNFAKQLLADQFAKIDGMCIAEKSGQGYVLSENKIYEFEL